MTTSMVIIIINVIDMKTPGSQAIGPGPIWGTWAQGPFLGVEGPNMNPDSYMIMGRGSASPSPPPLKI
eukprot:2744695-Karenia_brevis.AAC.1